MANTALIEDLLKQFETNPRRVFARLANEYRKIGELDTAIQICREHVPHQPTYISGYIVLGQALFESGQLDESRTTFETALGLDPENLIALRQLGDIARANGDTEGARSWYHRLLEVDPQNDEIAAQLREMEPPAPAPASEPVSWSDINPELGPTAAGGEPVVESPAPPSVTGFEPTSFGFETPEAPAPEPIDFDFDALDAPPAPPAPPAPREPTLAADLASLDDLEFPTADEIASNAAREPREEAPAVPIEGLLADPFGLELGVATNGAAPAPAAAPRRDDEGAPTFATETMAELYLQQGFTDRALDIYRRLANERPNDVELRDRIARLERGGVPVARDGVPSPRTMRAFFGTFASRRAPASADRHAPAAEIGDESVPPPIPASYRDVPDIAPEAGEREPAPRATRADRGPADGLTELFGAVPVDVEDERAAAALSAAFSREPVSGGAIAGQPARAASDRLSLDDVFRDGRQRGDAAASRPAADVTFDEFFSREDAPDPSADAQPDAPSAGAAEGEGGEKDLELFHAWLEGLKK